MAETNFDAVAGTLNSKLTPVLLIDTTCNAGSDKSIDESAFNNYTYLDVFVLSNSSVQRGYFRMHKWNNVFVSSVIPIMQSGGSAVYVTINIASNGSITNMTNQAVQVLIYGIR